MSFGKSLEGESSMDNQESKLLELIKRENLELAEKISLMNKFDAALEIAKITEADSSQAEVINMLVGLRKGSEKSLLEMSPEEIKNFME